MGMVSLIMPRESWVAKWNDIRTFMPGVYAINVPCMFEGDEEGLETEQHERRGNHDQDREKNDDLGDWLAPDDDEDI